MYDHDHENNERATRIVFSEKNHRKDPGLEIDIRAKKFMSADPKLSYRDATRRVYAEDEDLHALYLNTTPPMRHS